MACIQRAKITWLGKKVMNSDALQKEHLRETRALYTCVKASCLYSVTDVIIYNDSAVALQNAYKNSCIDKNVVDFANWIMQLIPIDKNADWNRWCSRGTLLNYITDYDAILSVFNLIDTHWKNCRKNCFDVKCVGSEFYTESSYSEDSEESEESEGYTKSLLDKIRRFRKDACGGIYTMFEFLETNYTIEKPLTRYLKNTKYKKVVLRLIYEDITYNHGCIRLLEKINTTHKFKNENLAKNTSICY
jgi:hypothetical protein